MSRDAMVRIAVTRVDVRMGYARNFMTWCSVKLTNASADRYRIAVASPEDTDENDKSKIQLKQLAVLSKLHNFFPYFFSLFSCYQCMSPHYIRTQIHLLIRLLMTKFSVPLVQHRKCPTLRASTLNPSLFLPTPLLFSPCKWYCTEQEHIFSTCTPHVALHLHASESVWIPNGCDCTLWDTIYPQ